MTPAEVAKVLAKASAFDRRTIGRAEISVWHEVLATVDFTDALEAVTRHYAADDRWLMPVHVRTLAAEVRRERQRTVRQAAEARAIESERADLRPLRDRSAELQAFVRQVRDVLPAGDPDQLRRKEWLAHDRERARRRRWADVEPNPLYDPTALDRLAAMVAEEGSQ